MGCRHGSLKPHTKPRGLGKSEHRHRDESRLQTVKPPRDQEIGTRRVLSTGIHALNKATSLRGCFSPLPAQVTFTTPVLFSYFLGKTEGLMQGQSGKGTAQPSLQSWVFQGEGLVQRWTSCSHQKDRKLWSNGACVSSPESLTEHVSSEQCLCKSRHCTLKVIYFPWVTSMLELFSG